MLWVFKNEESDVVHSGSYSITDIRERHDFVFEKNSMNMNQKIRYHAVIN